MKRYTDKEVIELTSFKGGDETFYYKDIKTTTQNKDDFSFVLMSGEVIYTKSKDLINKIKAGKARYDLTISSLEQQNKDKEEIREFKNEIKSILNEQMKEVDNKLKSDREELHKTISIIKSSLNSTIEDMNSEVQKLNKIDIDRFTKTLDKMDKITDTFSDLLK